MPDNRSFDKIDDLFAENQNVRRTSKVEKLIGRVVAYVRTSDDKQDEKSQREVMTRAASTAGVSIADWYLDPGRSRHAATTSEVFSRLIADGEAKKFDWVLVESKMRFGTKDSDEYGYYATRLKRSGVGIYSVAQGNLTGSGDHTTLINAVDSVTSIAEQREKSRRVNRGMFGNALKGNWNGGKQLLGYDRRCISPDGQEVFRVIDLAADRRIVVQPDGSRQERNGRRNPPGKHRLDRYVFVKTELLERIELVRTIFKRFANEAITQYTLAKDLNENKAPRIYGDCWHADNIDSILKNPIYVGRPTWGKSTKAAFFVMASDGSDYIEAKWSGKKPTQRVKDHSEWVPSTEVIEDLRIIDDETWITVQQKLNKPKRRASVPRSDELWLRPLVVCSSCQRPMRGWAPRSMPKERSYFCPTYQDWKTVENPHGCRKNRIRASIIEEKLSDFLNTYGVGIHATVAKRSARVDKLLLETGDAESLLFDIIHQMKEFVLRHLPSDQHHLLGVEGGIAIDEAYRHYHEREGQGTVAKIATLKIQLRQQVRARVGLEPGGTADQFAIEDIRDTEKQIADLASAVVPIDERLDAIYADLERLDRAIISAQSAIQGSANREKAEAVAKVVKRIVVVHEPNEKAQGNASRNSLKQIIFEPHHGKAVAYEMERHHVKKAIIHR